MLYISLVGVSDSRVKNFTFIEAVRKLPTNFTPQELRPILLKAGNRFSGRLRSTFVVLSDDTSVVRSSEASVEPEEVELDDDNAFVQVQHGQTGRKKKRGPDSQAGNKAKR